MTLSSNVSEPLAFINKENLAHNTMFIASQKNHNSQQEKQKKLTLIFKYSTQANGVAFPKVK